MARDVNGPIPILIHGVLGTGTINEKLELKPVQNQLPRSKTENVNEKMEPKLIQNQFPCSGTRIINEKMEQEMELAPYMGQVRV